ncbi:IS200-type transposase ISNph7 [Natronomonas pharaonis DSM 2160]|uniref:IS200-type transposase ISNph7 n=1 Tax=Natronomonas pharaonis (strain ATCC 35678 / DSM 2160 / CIP 103997 / JCM 8858 / NBRC 14720 / NCIMB 2260 / Gabara) TaxID=348780 RepID=A0A1U7EYS8_NATPD|nr:IS200/IS605-like element ISNph7 family transposase [Natronomonas pharaonis]CAI50406.1 IS200-type transposase ISNph7 [Natronomonas pharaonis DSM 2160]
MGETRSNHTVYNINYHFVWCPKSSKSKICVPRGISDPAQYRHSVLDEIEQSLEASFKDVCGEYNYEIPSLHISPDHVHLFLSAHPKYSPSKIARKIKSITAREMWQQHEHLLENYLWGGGFWEESYYIGTAGEVSSQTIEQYIERTEHV